MQSKYFTLSKVSPRSRWTSQFKTVDINLEQFSLQVRVAKLLLPADTGQADSVKLLKISFRIQMKTLIGSSKPICDCHC